MFGTIPVIVNAAALTKQFILNVLTEFKERGRDLLGDIGEIL